MPQTNMLEGVVVVDFSQFLSGPSASLSLSDMGATVIKVEKPGTGDICRELYVSDVVIDGESSIFHAINRNKLSYEADLKKEADLVKIKKLIQQADIVMHNFRPGVMERLGLDYATVKALHPSVVYASISGYGETGPWSNLPGQDLLLQSMSGLAWLNHQQDADPTPMGVSVVDILAGSHLVQGILALLYQRGVNGEGGQIQVSMLESALDFQFEALTCYYNDGRALPERSKVNSGHAYVSAPYGIYQTVDSYIALAMGDIVKIGGLIGCEALAVYTDPGKWFAERDIIKSHIVTCLLENTTQHWMDILEPAGIWCSRVLDYQALQQEDAYKELHMEVVVKNSNGISITTTRSPLKVDGAYLVSEIGAPLLGEHNKDIEDRFNMGEAAAVVVKSG